MSLTDVLQKVFAGINRAVSPATRKRIRRAAAPAASVS